ncbi:glypican-6-like protein [Leptotrombidium deliense]|uniref:Glypican-6-like protein n=1 Tax=Leptotrombidium deliense TaxID=299467 RepID=A0A443SNK7_9ACAR|nr:glypican-6-like protein [Leptotrombidium deliense]
MYKCYSKCIWSLYFTAFSRELLRNSKEEFNRTFVKTYGKLYTQHAYIFIKMLTDLERYYSQGGVDLSKVFDVFFRKLYRKMFQVMHLQYTLNEQYLRCVDENMDVVKPFGEVPKKLTIEVKRSLVATRTFTQALSNAADVVKIVMEIDATDECTRSIMQMTYCPHCQGLPNLKPCSNYCLQVMRTCLSMHRELDSEWNNYVDALLLLSNRLETSFNIESVVNPIAIRISEAIMDFQENNSAISQRLYGFCGKPRIARREGKQRLTSLEQLKFARPQKRPQPHTAAGTNIDTLLEEVRLKIRGTKGFWKILPQNLCKHSHFSRTTSKECWNGTNKVK